MMTRHNQSLEKGNASFTRVLLLGCCIIFLLYSYLEDDDVDHQEIEASNCYRCVLVVKAASMKESLSFKPSSFLSPMDHTSTRRWRKVAGTVVGGSASFLGNGVVIRSPFKIRGEFLTLASTVEEKRSSEGSSITSSPVFFLDEVALKDPLLPKTMTSPAVPQPYFRHDDGITTGLKESDMLNLRNGQPDTRTSTGNWEKEMPSSSSTNMRIPNYFYTLRSEDFLEPGTKWLGISEKTKGKSTGTMNNNHKFNGKGHFDEDDIASGSKNLVTLRSLWRTRHARSAEEGIRREKTNELSTVLDKARGDMIELFNRRANKYGTSRNKFAARTITGIINALAEEVDGLEVQVNTDRKTPIWKKKVDDITIQFSRLGFKPLHISGGIQDPGQRIHHYQARSFLGIYDETKNGVAKAMSSVKLASKNVLRKHQQYSVHEPPINFDDNSYVSPTADEAFDRIDIDNSDSLDRDELIQALNLAASASFEDVDEDNQLILENLANDLVELYDFNGDGVVDRKEYKSMVADMAALRRKQIERQQILDEANRKHQGKGLLIDSTKNRESRRGGWLADKWSWIGFMRSWIGNKIGFRFNNNNEVADINTDTKSNAIGRHESKGEVEVLDSPSIMHSVAKTLGSVTFSDVKLDLRRLFFGVVPILKYITPGGPLILEPFTVTVNGSFKREDIMNSFLLDAGLRRLVGRVLRIRVGFLRDFFEGALFYGRSWNMFGESGPKVEVPELTEIEFDENNKLIVTGRARVKTSPDAPVVEQVFKVRTRIGTRQNGRFLRLEEPELALVLECPKNWWKNIAVICNALKINQPPRPKPLYSFFPIYSPFKLNDDGGFDLGEDNTINSLYIDNGALCFEMSSVLRPGRFLGSHYLAFSVPNRTFIVTLDRVTEGMRAARKTKKAAQALRQSMEGRVVRRRSRKIIRQDKEGTTATLPGTGRTPKVRSFFGRFVDGYLQAEREEEKKERITTAIRDFFGRQGTKLVSTSITTDPMTNDK